MTNSEEALKYIREGMIVGLGTGSAATAFIRALGERVERGLKIIGVPTSEKSAALAKELGIPLKTLDEVHATLDVCVDGADEFDPQLNLIKGLGGALVREKIVAAAARSAKSQPRGPSASAAATASAWSTPKPPFPKAWTSTSGRAPPPWSFPSGSGCITTGTGSR